MIARMLVTLAAAASLAAVAAPADLTADQIVARNIAARGGVEAWRKVDTMVWYGHVVAAGAGAERLPFIMEFKRPDKTRFEIEAHDQMSARIFDGSHGWRVVQARGAMPQMHDYGADDIKSARDAGGIGGPLVDYAAKGVAIALEGSEDVDGHPAYRLQLKLPSGDVQRVWIDAGSFLELKYERTTRNAFGMTGQLVVAYRDYRTVDGLTLPMTIESGVGAGKVGDRMVIDRVAVGAALDDNLFARPNLPERRPAGMTGRPAGMPGARLPGALGRR
jgi:outer membrane lipoprotein-sorting protein